MHASPSFQINVRCFGAWRAASSGLVVLTLGVSMLWAQHAVHFAAAWAGLGIAWAVFFSMAVLMHSWRLRPMSLRWDTQQWSLGASETRGSEALAGRVSVALDLGSAMLLHFVPNGARGIRLGVWLPVQRRGHERDWHALRCTVYCARPITLPNAAPF